MNEAAFGSRRGAASAVLRAACSEVRPAMSFPEQSNFGSDLTSALSCGLQDVEPGTDEDSLAEILDQVLSTGTATPIMSLDMIGLSSGNCIQECIKPFP
mmetsp:Transcript_23016/g.48967  ORF Transcript_23016/g.48967 Transcript_23016/m.48967 type:complete len:99 (+) Transcript_23016:2-298(+)